jgi:UDP-glucose:(heptosyl)LPS alpha-1,3-glucosyltransferase
VNIAFVLQHFSPWGGTGRYSQGLAKWLLDQGHQIHVYCGEYDIEDEALERCVIHPIGGQRRGRLGIGQFYLASQNIPFNQHDVVQGFGRSFGHQVFRAGGGAHRAWLRTQSLGWRHWVRGTISPASRLEEWMDKRAIMSAKIVVCNSAMAASDLRYHYRVPTGKIYVVRNGVDGNRFKPNPTARLVFRQKIGIPEEGRIALFVGNGYRRKGMMTAVQAFCHVAKSSDRLVLVGKDAHEARYRGKLTARLGKRLHLLGFVKGVEEVMAAADLMVLPTHYDSAANTTLEGMSCGVPVVTTAKDGNAELLPDSALRVEDPRDVGSFSNAMRYAWEHYQTLSPLCRAVTQDWPISRNAMEMERIYKEYVDASKA